MHTRKIRRYVITPVFYVALIFGLLYLQYSGTLTVRRSIGDLRFVGTLVAGEDETSHDISAATVEFAGILFHFSEDRPLTIEGDHTITLIPERYDIQEKELTITFSDGSAIRFEVALDSPADLHVVPVGTEAWPRDAQLLIPWEPAPETTLNPRNASTPDIFDVAYGDRSLFLSVPPQSVVEPSEGYMTISLSAGSRLIRYAERVDTETDVIQTAFGDGQRQIGDSFYAGSIDRYIDVAFQGWGSTRYNGGSGTWSMRDGSPRFSEEILTAYLAEAWRRNQYTTAFNQMRRAADQHSDQIGFLSTVFLGNLREVTNRFIAADQQRSVALTSRISAGDPSVFREPDLVPFAALRGSESLYEDVMEFARTVDFREVDIKAAIGMFGAAVSGDHPSDESRAAFRRFEAIAEERILPAIRQFDDVFFVQSTPGEIDVLYSIRAGVHLERYGRRTGEILYVTVGRNLVLSGLQLADNRGFLPHRLFFGEEELDRQEGSFGPEDLYTDLTDNPAYPRMIPLYDELGHGSFIWTVADFTGIDIGSDQYSFSLEYPRNRTHYILMQGIPQFESMILFNLQWRNDPSFELYIKGRHYEAQSETLMIKYTDDSVAGDIILFY